MPAPDRRLGEGRLITFEGGEGAGKSTQVARLRLRLEAAGRSVVVTREPGGSPRAERIRTALLGGAAEALGPFAETILFAAARADHVRETIRPAISAGRIVLCDRFIDSTRVYQGVAGRVDKAVIGTLERLSTDATQPDLTLILDVPAKLGLARAEERRRAKGESSDRFEAQGLDYHTRIRDGFLAIAREEPSRCAVIAASGPPDEVEELIWTEVKSRLLSSDEREPTHATEQADG